MSRGGDSGRDSGGDSRDAGAVRATLDAWRERGADRVNPVRFHFIEALERRAAGHGGEARRILDDRLSTLLADYADDLERRAASAVDEARGAASPGASPHESLAGLIAYIGGIHSAVHASGPAASRSAAYPELEMLDYFRELASRARTEKQLRQSLEQVPGNAGPLNSSSLVHRSLSLMRELSPGYLKQFLSYVDALSWMEQMTGGAAAGKDAPRAASAGKSARGKSR